jgi:hypothetical protein
MKSWTCRLVLAVLSAMPLGCGATSRIADAVVTERDGKPCFLSSDPLAMRNLQAVLVSDMSSIPPTVVWGVLVEPDQESSRSEGCVGYGQTFASQKTTAPASVLRTGRVYHVFLNAPSANSGDPTRGYEMEFCLVAQSDTAKPAIRQVIWDKKLRRRPYEICGIQTR